MYQSYRDEGFTTLLFIVDIKSFQKRTPDGHVGILVTLYILLYWIIRNNGIELTDANNSWYYCYVLMVMM
jgi:hypothetical protein